MFILILKFILAFILTMIPFVFHYWVKPKSKESPKWENLISLLETKLPVVKRRKRRVYAWLVGVYRKMKFSRNARKFFTYILVVFMLIVQVVDFQASKYAQQRLGETTSIVAAKGSYDKPAVVKAKRKASEMMLRSHTTPFWAFNLCLIVTLATFSFKLADMVLTKIHNVRWIKWGMGAAILLIVVLSVGRLMLVSEIAYLILLAGLIYPNPNFEEYGKWHKRITHRCQRKSVEVVSGEQQRQSA